MNEGKGDGLNTGVERSVLDGRSRRGTVLWKPGSVTLVGSRDEGERTQRRKKGLEERKRVDTPR